MLMAATRPQWLLAWVLLMRPSPVEVMACDESIVSNPDSLDQSDGSSGLELLDCELGVLDDRHKSLRISASRLSGWVPIGLMLGTGRDGSHRPFRPAHG